LHRFPGDEVGIKLFEGFLNGAGGFFITECGFEKGTAKVTLRKTQAFVYHYFKEQWLQGGMRKIDICFNRFGFCWCV